MCDEGDERDEAEHFGQLHVGSLAAVHHSGTLDDGVEDVGVEIQTQRQEDGRPHQQQHPHELIINVGEAGEADAVQVIHLAAEERHGELLQPNGEQREEQLQAQEQPAAHQPPPAAHHRQVDGEADEGDVVEGGRAGQVFGAHHELAQAGAQQPAAVLPPVDGHGPQAQVEQVAAGAAQDEDGHVAPDLAPPAEQAGHQRDQDEDVQAEGGHQEQDFGGGTKVQVGGDGAGRGGCHIHGSV